MGDGKGSGTGCAPGDNRNGGPRTAAGIATVTGNLTVPPGEAALTHQSHRFLAHALAPACSRCVVNGPCERFTEGGTCSLAEEAQAEVLAGVLALPHVQDEDLPLCREYAKTVVGLAIVDRYLAATSPFLPGAESGYLESQPVLKTRQGLSSALVRLAGELGLSPASRHRLRSDPDNGAAGELGRVLAEVRRAEAKEKAATLDADFTAEEAGDDGHTAAV